MVRIAVLGLVTASLASLGSLAAVLQGNTALVEQSSHVNAGWEYTDCGAQ